MPIRGLLSCRYRFHALTLEQAAPVWPLRAFDGFKITHTGFSMKKKDGVL
jgi:hypothetical protein